MERSNSSKFNYLIHIYVILNCLFALSNSSSITINFYKNNLSNPCKLSFTKKHVQNTKNYENAVHNW